MEGLILTGDIRGGTSQRELGPFFSLSSRGSAAHKKQVLFLSLCAVSFSVRTAPYRVTGDCTDELVIRWVSLPDSGVQY